MPMPTPKIRNAFYRGWFAARAFRPLPAPDSDEEAIYLGMGFIDGKRSGGKPLPGLSPPKLSIRPKLNIDLDPTKFPKTPQITSKDLPKEGIPASRARLNSREEPALAPAPAEETENLDNMSLRFPEKKLQNQLPRNNPFGGKSTRRRYNF
jgi:hypothetical protein